MIRGNPLRYLALGACLASLLLAISASGQESTKPEQRPAENQSAVPDPQEQPADDPTGESPNAPAPSAPDGGSANDGNSESGQNGESEQQPNSVQEIGNWSFWGDTPAQWIMAFFGAVATLVSIYAVRLLRETLTATRAAVKEAEAATGEARRHANIAEKSAQVLDRPYPYITPKPSLELANPGAKRPFLNYRIVNYGRTPATILGIYTELTPTPKLSDRQSLGRWAHTHLVIPPGAGTEFRAVVKGSHEGDRWVGKDAAKLALRVVLEYEDPAGTIYEDWFLFQCTDGAKSLIQAGGRDNNKRTVRWRADEPEGAS